MYVGSTGNSTGPHLHFEVRIGGSGYANKVDPLPYITSDKEPIQQNNTNIQTNINNQNNVNNTNNEENKTKNTIPIQ